jgi:hypothetical protein
MPSPIVALFTFAADLRSRSACELHSPANIDLGVRDVPNESKGMPDGLIRGNDDSYLPVTMRADARCGQKVMQGYVYYARYKRLVGAATGTNGEPAIACAARSPRNDLDADLFLSGNLGARGCDDRSRPLVSHSQLAQCPECCVINLYILRIL